MERLLDDAFNQERKKALSKIENHEKPSNIDLGLLGLTTYFSEETLSNSLFEKVLFAENDERRIKHIQDRKCFFMPLQEEALSFIKQNKRVILLAPTSFGKTLILKEFIFVEKPSVVAYIVPTNALGYELESSFKANKSFDDYLIFDKERDEGHSASLKKPFFIGTQEKYLEIKDKLPPIDLFVIDEAYKLEDKTTQQRGYKLSKSFFDTINDNANRVVLLCPVANAVGFDEYSFKKFETRFNAVDRRFHPLPIDAFYQELNRLSREEKTIFFCKSPTAINESMPLLRSVTEPERRFLSDLKADFHSEWSVVKYYEKGILVHHGQMPKYIQNKMMNMFLMNSNYKLLVGTNSISEGINTPTKNVFIHPGIQCHERNMRMLIKNTIGRAGRLGIMPLGHIFSVERIDDLDSEDSDMILYISSEDGMEEINDTLDDTKIIEACSKYFMDEEFLKSLIKETKMSLKTLRSIFDVLKENQRFAGYDSLPFMARKVFEEYYTPKDDCVLIKGVFQSFYKENEIKKPLNTFSEKVAFFRLKAKPKNTVTDSDIVDSYMRFIYSTLDNYLLVIANVAKRIMNKYDNWAFGENVKTIINTFLKRYYEHIYGVEDFDSFSPNSQKIIQALREYGISLTDSLIDVGLVEEIETKLDVRYSTFDIINAIKEISASESPFSRTCTHLLNKYF